jgi:hypothetical protein
VLALAALAVADAFRRDGGDGADRRSDAAAVARAEAARRLKQAGITGVLVVTSESCDLRAFRLPGLRPAPPPEGLDVGCDFEVSPDGRRVAPPGAVWHRWGGTYAICRGRAVDVLVPPNARPIYQYDGCAPAWRRSGRPEETLTVAREEGILEVRPSCAGQPPCERLLLSGALLRRAAIRHPATPSDLRLVAGVDVQAVVWPAADRAAVLLRARLSGPARGVGPLQVVALVDGGRLGWTRFDPAASGLKLSPLGNYLVAEPREIFRPNGSQVSLPPAVARFTQAVSWSPDERWLAVATGSTIVVMRVGELERFDDTGRRPRTITLPIAARDLAWREAATVRP